MEDWIDVYVKWRVRCLIACAALLIVFPAAGHSQTIYPAGQFNWVNITQGECFNRARQAARQANSAFGLGLNIGDYDGWLVGNSNQPVHLQIACVGDDGIDRLANPSAPRVLIVIEGLDGAGKRTLTDGLRAALGAAGKTVATLAFPRYGDSATADLAAAELHGGRDGLADSAYAMAMLFALDRAGAAAEISALCAEHDVVILDRYVASNAAYTAARLHQGAESGPAR